VVGILKGDVYFLLFVFLRAVDFDDGNRCGFDKLGDINLLFHFQQELVDLLKEIEWVAFLFGYDNHVDVGFRQTETRGKRAKDLHFDIQLAQQFLLDFGDEFNIELLILIILIFYLLRLIVDLFFQVVFQLLGQHDLALCWGGEKGLLFLLVLLDFMVNFTLILILLEDVVCFY
jgi:hypothetical protein